ncbi:MAG: response regulator [Nitrospirae bacterium]|nr:MAG: response regulator [Nitrospirota bacterium]
MNFRDMTIQKKLTLILMSAVAAAIFFASVTFYIVATNYFRRSYENDLVSLAKIIGKSCEAAVAFHVPEDAARALASLSVRPSIMYAVITYDNGKPLADYHTPAIEKRTAAGGVVELKDPNLKVSQDIVVAGRRTGAITLYDDMSGIRKARTIGATVMALAAVVAMSIGMMLIARMRMVVSSPIEDLALAARRISESQDFSLRVEKHANDEVGALVDDFNSMIEQIEKRNRERAEAEEERKSLVAQLQQSQKMEAIGTLAGGIAHDFNNILSAIIGYAQLAKMELPEGGLVQQHLDHVLYGSSRATDLVKQILTFSRRGEHKKAVVELVPLVKEAVKLLRASIPSFIEIKLNAAIDRSSVFADPTHIHQIVMNLGTNAYHAMRDKGGVLYISLENVSILDQDNTKLIHLSAGDYVRLTVSDTGHGMEKSVMDRIFDPYFTTKAQGDGTGLGLSVVHGIVKSLNGHISVYSEPGQGTTFHIYLPESKTAAEEKGPEEKKMTGGTERLLIVDDEEDIIGMLEVMLPTLGYKVKVTTDPFEALDSITKTPEAYDLLITDMTMPKMLGTQLALEALGLRPDMPVILCSGFSDKMNEETARSMGISAYVIKPFILSEFSGIIRAVLDRNIKPAGA